MMKTKRYEELMAGMDNSFKKDGYFKSELLNEMFTLQREIVDLTLGTECETTEEFKIWDVEKYLEQLNNEKGHIADDELQKFKLESKDLSNLIKGAVSGEIGEKKTVTTLGYIKSPIRVVQNVELGDGELHTEIDAVVITPKCITILEAKNTKKNIFIDEVGNYYRTGEFLKLDYNIAEKMDTKESLLRKVLDDAGYENIKINSILVFSNNRIEVHNRCNRIRTSFISQLPSIIEGYRLEDAISVEEMERIEGVIAAADSKIEYPFEFDVAQYKRDFANLMVKLEFGYEPCEETVMDNSPIRTEKTARKIVKKNITRQSLTPKELLHAGITAATIGTLAVVSFPLAAFYGVVIPRSIHRADCT